MLFSTILFGSKILMSHKNNSTINLKDRTFGDHEKVLSNKYLYKKKYFHQTIPFLRIGISIQIICTQNF